MACTCGGASLLRARASLSHTHTLSLSLPLSLSHTLARACALARKNIHTLMHKLGEQLLPPCQGVFMTGAGRPAGRPSALPGTVTPLREVCMRAGVACVGECSSV